MGCDPEARTDLPQVAVTGRNNTGLAPSAVRVISAGKTAKDQASQASLPAARPFSGKEPDGRASHHRRSPTML